MALPRTHLFQCEVVTSWEDYIHQPRLASSFTDWARQVIQLLTCISDEVDSDSGILGKADFSKRTRPWLCTSVCQFYTNSWHFTTSKRHVQSNLFGNINVQAAGEFYTHPSHSVHTRQWNAIKFYCISHLYESVSYRPKSQLEYHIILCINVVSVVH